MAVFENRSESAENRHLQAAMATFEPDSQAASARANNCSRDQSQMTSPMVRRRTTP